MKKIITGIIFSLLLAACGGGGSSSDPITFNPSMSVDSMGSGGAFRLLTEDIKWRSINNKTNFLYMQFWLEIPESEKGFIDSDGWYDFSFWNSFKLIGADGSEYFPMPENAGVSFSSRRNMLWNLWLAPGYCQHGDPTDLGVSKTGIRCYLLFEVPQDFVAKEGLFMSEFRILREEIDKKITFKDEL